MIVGLPRATAAKAERRQQRNQFFLTAIVIGRDGREGDQLLGQRKRFAHILFLKKLLIDFFGKADLRTVSGG